MDLTKTLLLFQMVKDLQLNLRVKARAAKIAWVKIHLEAMNSLRASYKYKLKKEFYRVLANLRIRLEISSKSCIWLIGEAGKTQQTAYLS